MIHATQFMAWTQNETWPVTLERLKKARGNTKATPHHTTFHIPAAYHRIVCQLVAELRLAKRTDQHEVHRREVYARQVLDAFGGELERFRGFTNEAMAGFRSAILTPILQRQLCAVPDAYTPSIHRGVKGHHTELTIQAATEFYLKEDPTDPENIPNYHRNLLYIHEARWHLGCVMETVPDEGDDKKHIEYYNQFLEDHDRIMLAVKDGYKGYSETGIPYLTPAERTAIEREQLEDFFTSELAMPVRHAHPSYTPPSCC